MERLGGGGGPLASTARLTGTLALFALTVAAVFMVSGCSNAPTAPAGSAEPTSAVGAAMAGPVVDVNISQLALAAKPAPPDQTSPESAVRSYLDWTSYAYRIAQSSVAVPTMTSLEEVHVDAYVQLNLQRSRLIEQTLDSITFGTPSAGATSTIVTAKEQWTYSYLSIEAGNKVLGGPHTVSYDTTYTLVKDAARGVWLVDSVEAKALGPVK